MPGLMRRTPVHWKRLQPGFIQHRAKERRRGMAKGKGEGRVGGHVTVLVPGEARAVLRE